VDADIIEVNGRTLAQGTMGFKVHNTDAANDLTLTVGFPSWAGRSASFDPTKFNIFKTTLDNKTVSFDTGTAPVRYDDVERDVPWYTFQLQLGPDEKKTITTEFQQDLGDGVLPRFAFGMLPGNRWKNAISSARIAINLPVATTGEQFLALDPTVPTFNGQKLTWLWTDLNPENDPGITFIRPSTWQTLTEQSATRRSPPIDQPQERTDFEARVVQPRRRSMTDQ